MENEISYIDTHKLAEIFLNFGFNKSQAEDLSDILFFMGLDNLNQMKKDISDIKDNMVTKSELNY